MMTALTVAAVVYGVVTVAMFVIFLGFYLTSWSDDEREDAARIARGAPLWPVALAVAVREMLATARRAKAREELGPVAVVVERRQRELETLPRCDRPGCTRTDLAPVWFDRTPLDMGAGNLCPEHMPERISQ